MKAYLISTILWTKSTLIWSLKGAILASILATLLYTSTEVRSFSLGLKTRLLGYLMDRDLFSKEVTLDRKGKTVKGSEITTDQAMQALYLCTAQNEQLRFNLGAIKEYTE